MESIFSTILTLIDHPVLLFALMFTASIMNTFFPPIPIEIGTIFVGYLVSTGHGSLELLIIATALGMTVGNFVVYRLGWHYGLEESLRTGRSRRS